jgi:hypothetical protein
LIQRPVLFHCSVVSLHMIFFAWYVELVWRTWRGSGYLFLPILIPWSQWFWITLNLITVEFT